MGTILITGGCSFIGCQVTSDLANGRHADLAVNATIHMHGAAMRGDVRNADVPAYAIHV
jgi:nucleoside-diphosphate-sugar epimerase